jgi:hypothetical protein
VQVTKLIFEIEPILGRSSEGECEPRSLEQRSRWLKFADLALQKKGRRPSHSDVKEITALSRTEQRAIKDRIHGSVENFRHIRSGKAQRRKAA